MIFDFKLCSLIFSYKLANGEGEKHLKWKLPENEIVWLFTGFRSTVT